MIKTRICHVLLAASSAVLVVACSARAEHGGDEDCAMCALPVREHATKASATEPSDAGTPPPSAPSAPADAKSPTPAPASGLVAGSVPCGAITCSGTTPVCCEGGLDDGKCVAKGASCLLGNAIACDQAADCDVGMVCCVDTSNGRASCTARASCNSDKEEEACASDSDCVSGETCKKAPASAHANLICQ